MDIGKAPDELVELFDSILPTAPSIERRKMFGQPCAFVNGNMFTGLHGPRMVLRLPEERRREFLTIEGATLFEPMPGRPMKEYVVIPEAVLKDGRVLRDWLDQAFLSAAALPVKEPKPRGGKPKAAKRRESP
jgi:TfoX/Sxy family transcriptional regulator of competence genes